MNSIQTQVQQHSSGPAGSRSTQKINPTEKKEYYDISLRENDYVVLNKGLALNMSYQFGFDNLNVRAFRKATLELVRLEEILRTTYIYVGDKIKRKIHDFETFNFSIEELDLSGEPFRYETLEAIYLKEGKFLFNTEKGPLMKAILCDLGGGKYKFILVMHHVICDAMSVSILTRLQLNLYKQFLTSDTREGTPSKIQYKDYAIWQNRMFENGQKAQGRAYWQNKLCVYERPISYEVFKNNYTKEFPMTGIDESTRYQTHAELSGILNDPKGRTLSLTTNNKVREDIIKLAMENKFSPFGILLVSLSALLFKLNAQQKILFAVPSTNRFLLNETKEMIGNMMGDIYVSIEINDAMTLNDIMKSLKKDMAESSKHTITGYQDFEGLSFRTITSLFVNYLDKGIVGPKQLNHPEVILGNGKQNPFCALECVVREFTNGFFLDWRFNRKIFTDEMIQYLANCHISILASMHDDWDAPIGRHNTAIVAPIEIAGSI